MDTTVPPCTVCGGTDLNLVDGYYYCTECGTQDVTIRETIIEYATREDGTLAFHTQTKKIKSDKDTRDLSPEWYKWHAYNLIVAGLAEELETLGAGEGFKLRVLWVWAKYVRKYRKDVNGRTEEENDKQNIEHESDVEESEAEQVPPKRIVNGSDFRTYKVKKLMMSVVQGILNAALNINGSQVQVGDLRRFIREERVSCRNCLRFIPPDFNLHKLDPMERCLDTVAVLCDTVTIRGYTMTLFKELNLGKPNMPNLNNLVDRYITELFLPQEFRKFVFVLMNFIPVCLEVDFLHGVPRVPDYEGVAMAYVVIALKIFFGLDDEYENMLSTAVENYNNVNDCSKVLKYASVVTKTDRLFSFREWSIHIEFRNRVISKYYFPAALNFNEEIDSQVFISHTNDRARKNHVGNVGEEVMMEILGTLNADINNFRMPKIEFPHTLTPMATYTDVILEKVNDPEIKNLLNEDFTKYSLEYITDDLKITENSLSGINIEHFTISRETMDAKITKYFEIDKTAIFVRNCENDNWLKTKAPTSKHVRASEEDSYICQDESSRSSILESVDINNGSVKDSASESGQRQDNELTLNDNSDNIFDDDFNVTVNDLWGRYIKDEEEEVKDLNSRNLETTEINYNIIDDSVNERSFQINSEETSNFDNLNREAAIEVLLQTAQKEYGINMEPKPKRKRKLFVPTESYGAPEEPRQKRPRQVRNPTQRAEAQKEIENIIENYYETLKNKRECSVQVQSISNLFSDRRILNLNRSNSTVQQTTDNISTVEPTTENNVNVEHADSSSVLEGISVNETFVDNGPEGSVILEEKSKQIENNKNFDEKNYDSGQLYLRINNEVNEDQDKQTDAEIIDFFRHKEQEIQSQSSQTLEKEPDKKKSDSKETNEDGYDSDSISLSDLVKRLQRYKEVNEEFVNIKNKNKFKPHNYWTLHYWCNYPPMNFENELNTRFSRSFAWALRLCASVIDTSTRALYLQVTNLENDLKQALSRKYSK